MALFTRAVSLMNSIFYNSTKDMGQKKLETFCGRKWVRVESHRAVGRGRVVSDTISLNQMGRF